ncbi:uncharacterized protein LOC120006508 [Tripterygium wilfordii]|uniref:uncharacterized protein LOC120006508 n=1 Tax=Tripterygium wilfordii TaxID=458696 RepID=UPI0018F85561|nr:uncharacterized protein LOC120006508 [Tripterygium wilfordii]
MCKGSINALIRTVRSKNLDSPSGLWFCCCWWWRLLGLGQDWSENMKALAASIGEIDSYLGFFMKMGLKQMGFWSLMGCRISTSQVVSLQQVLFFLLFCFLCFW